MTNTEREKLGKLLYEALEPTFVAHQDWPCIPEARKIRYCDAAAKLVEAQAKEIERLKASISELCLGDNASGPFSSVPEMQVGLLRAERDQQAKEIAELRAECERTASTIASACVECARLRAENERLKAERDSISACCQGVEEIASNAEADLASAVGLLRELQSCIKVDGHRACPVCKAWIEYGGLHCHKEDCRLAALLARHDKEKPDGR